MDCDGGTPPTPAAEPPALGNLGKREVAVGALSVCILGERLFHF